MFSCTLSSILCVFLTDAKELRVHAVEVTDKEEGVGSRGVKEEQVAGSEVQEQTSSMDHQ